MQHSVYNENSVQVQVSQAHTLTKTRTAMFKSDLLFNADLWVAQTMHHIKWEEMYLKYFDETDEKEWQKIWEMLNKNLPF